MVGYPDDIKNAERLAVEWREKLFVAAVQKIERVRGVGPILDIGRLRDEMSVSDAMLYIETWRLREDIQSLDSDVKRVHEDLQSLDTSVKQVHAASASLAKSSGHLESLTRWLVGLTGVLTTLTIALVLISAWRLL